MTDYPLPVIGFSAFSGTGKTTLLKRLIPLLKVEGLRIGVVKHAHHTFDIDHPGKDSYELRHSGASKMLITSRRRRALVEEFPDDTKEPTLQQTLDALDPEALDIVLVEGFKAAHFPKIELHRPELGKPVMFQSDKDIIAIASNASASELGIDNEDAFPTYLKLDEPGDIVDFIMEFIRTHSQSNMSKRRA
jgi:molybdopterin-guanine dinucleotide biosynthesis protein B